MNNFPPLRGVRQGESLVILSEAKDLMAIATGVLKD